METVMDISLVKYSITDAAIAQMKEKYGGLEINSKDDYDVVSKAISVVRGKRTEVEKTRQAFKKDALEYGRMVDAEAKRITAELLEIEEPLKAKKQAVDNEVERKKAEVARIEAERVDAIKRKINGIRDYLDGLNNRSIEELTNAIACLDIYDIEQDIFQEFTEEAVFEKTETINALKSRLAEKQEAERQAEALRKLEEEAAALRAEKEKAEREAREKLEAERREKEAAEAKLRAIEEEKIRAQKEAELRARLEAEAKEKAEREAREKAEREEAERLRKEEAARREEALRPDKEGIS